MRMRTYLGLLLSAALALSACGDDDSGHPDAGNDAGTDAGHPQPKDSGTSNPGKDSGTDSGTDSGMMSMDPVARGDYLVNHVIACGDCHTPRKADGSLDESKKLSGVECFIDAVPNDDTMGCLSSRNLTNDATGLKNRSDQEIKDMFQKGMRPDGKSLQPVMPYWIFGNMNDDDANAIVAYLRTIPAVQHMIPPNQAPFTPPDMPAPTFPKAKIPMPSSSYPNQASAMRGRYLASSVSLCMECHTPRNDMQQPLVDKAFQGGEEFPRAELGLPPIFPDIIYSANITPDATGIRSWSVQDIVAAIKQGKDKDQGGAPLCPPMPAGPMGAFGGMTDDDATDIANYLKSIPPGENMIPVDCMMMTPSEVDGGTDDAGT